jgi:thiol-disulfide isomerase/thioredoxin
MRCQAQAEPLQPVRACWQPNSLGHRPLSSTASGSASPTLPLHHVVVYGTTMSSHQTARHDPPPGSPPTSPPDAGLPRQWPVVGLVLAALVVFVLAVGVLRVQRRVEATGTAGFTVADQAAVEADVAHRAVEFNGNLLADGSQWSSTSARGSLLVVNFWASWCGPCRVEQPELNRVARAYRGRGVKFIGINVRDSRGAATSYAQEFQIPYPSLFDQAALAAVRLQAVALPSTFILDRDGVIAYRLTGKTTTSILSARLDKLLGQGGRWGG